MLKKRNRRITRSLAPSAISLKRDSLHLLFSTHILLYTILKKNARGFKNIFAFDIENSAMFSKNLSRFSIEKTK